MHVITLFFRDLCICISASDVLCISSITRCQYFTFFISFLLHQRSFIKSEKSTFRPFAKILLLPAHFPWSYGERGRDEMALNKEKEAPIRPLIHRCFSNRLRFVRALSFTFLWVICRSNAIFVLARFLCKKSLRIHISKKERKWRTPDEKTAC